MEQCRGYNRGLSMDRVLGATRVTGQLELLVKWKNCEELDLVPAQQVNRRDPQKVIKFYENRILFKSRKGLRSSADVQPGQISYDRDHLETKETIDALSNGKPVHTT